MKRLAVYTTEADNTSHATAASRRNPLARYPLASFFLLTYALTWLGWSPWFLSKAGLGLLPFDGSNLSTLWNCVGLILGPTLSAFIVTKAADGNAGLRRLLQRLVLWRVEARWYVFALFGLPAVLLVSAAVMPGAVHAFNVSVLPPLFIKVIVLGFVALFISGPVFEEIGWRGFALPRLQARYGPLTASFLLGALWGLWHLPLFLIKDWDTPHGSLGDVILFVLLAVALAFILTWLFNHTRGSVLLAILAHGALNISTVTASELFPVPAVTEGFANFVVGLAVTAILIALLTRGRLGYELRGNDSSRKL